MFAEHTDLERGITMQLSVGLLLVSVLQLVTIASARSTPPFVSSEDKPAQDLQRRNLDTLAHDQDERRQSDENRLENGIHDIDLVPFGDVQRINSVANCVVNIAETGIKRSFSKCKAYIKEIKQFCHSTSGKKTHKDTCQSASMSISIAINECDVLAEKETPVTELCKTLVSPQTSKSSCKAGQLFGQVPGSSTTPVCFDAPQDKQSKTQVLPLRMYRPYQRYTVKNSVHLQAKAYNPKIRTPGALAEVHTLPIGQGDCTVIYCNGGQHAILFDCGSSKGNTLEISSIQSYFEDVSSITVMISHGHADHYNKIPEVFDLNTQLVNKINKIIVGGPMTDYSSNKIKKWLNGVNKSVEYQHDSTKIHKYYFCEDDITFEVVVGNANRKDLKNERGMVMKMSCTSCKSSLLFAGDMEGQAAEVMARRSKDTNDTFFGILNATHYKMAHHGASDKANSEDWLKAILPIEVYVSHVYNGKYRHPTCEAIERLKHRKCLGTTSRGGHDFTCISKKRERNGQFVRNHEIIQHRLYSTAPIHDKKCTIVLLFTRNKEATTNIFCGKQGTFFDTDTSDSEID